ncbi:MAG: hypothetical protein C9356_04445 [Oleiphilus sp.]|nr:MAG: hypothetical protein C9356_04445 [Oleiphilus sp.]
MSRLREYETFVTIVETLSLSSAAKQLHRSVSSVSKQLSSLEESLSAQLIHRSTQSLSVTDSGERFYRKCKEILSAVEIAEQGIKEERSVPIGKLSLSFPEVLLRTAFMQLVTEFSAKHPGIAFDLKMSNECCDLIDEKIDFAFRMGDLSDSRLTAIALTTFHPIFCAAPTYVEEHGIASTFEALLQDHRVIVPNYLNLSDEVRRFFDHSNKLPITLEVANTTNSESTMYQAAITGLCVGVFPDITVLEDIEQGRLVRVLPKTHLPEQTLWLLFKNSLYLPAKQTLFKEYMSEKKHFFRQANFHAS